MKSLPLSLDTEVTIAALADSALHALSSDTPESELITAFAAGLSLLPLESEPTALAAGSSSATQLCRTVGEIRYSSDRERIFADELFGDDDHFSLEPELTALASKLQLPIEKVPLGARVTTATTLSPCPSWHQTGNYCVISGTAR